MMKRTAQALALVLACLSVSGCIVEGPGYYHHPPPPPPPGPYRPPPPPGPPPGYYR